MKNVASRVLAPTTVALLFTSGAHQARAQTDPDEATLPTVNVSASADASAQGLQPAYPGGQVARGGRAGILGTNDNSRVPFSITSYTNELIQDKQAHSVGDVLQNDPTVRVARGFGNFQESYFIRGFILNSDDVAFNGLYSLLPRQYIAAELFERVEVLRGASAFLTGANPGGGGLGGSVNLLPKRAPNDPLTRATVSIASGSQKNASVDLARRFGPDDSTGMRFNAAWHDGGSAVDNEQSQLGLAALGLDWRSSNVRLSADLGWQDNKLDRTRPNVTLGPVSFVPRPPDPDTNFAQPWSFSNERDVFGTLRGEYDLTSAVTAWAAWGMRKTKEANSLANLTVTDASTGDGNFSRFDNTREDTISTGELGLRGKLRTGPVGHEWVLAAAYFRDRRSNAFAFDFANVFPNNLYRPQFFPQPAFSPATFLGNELDSPELTNRITLISYAIGDTLSFFDDVLLLTLGARHQQLKIENFAFNTGAPSPVYDKSRVSPAVGVVYKPTKQWSLYANYIEGLTQGDTATGNPPPVNTGQLLSPFITKQKEVGVKFDAGRVAVGLAAFSTSRPRSLINSANLFTSEGEDRHRGLELTLQGEATRNVRVLGGATLLRAKQESTGVAATEGQDVIGVPHFQANLGAEWDIPWVPGLTLDGRIVHTGASYVDAANTLKADGWTRYDLGMRYVTAIGGRALILRGRVENVTDKAYYASTGGFPGLGYLVVGAPRTFLLSASVDF